MYNYSNKGVSKVISVLTIVTFLLTNTAYGAPRSRSFFKNKKVDYKKLSTQREERLREKKSVLQNEDAAEKEQHKRQAKRVLSSHLEDLSQIHIPSELGRVTEVYQAPGDDSRLVVHIQDLHTNPEAQLNLASTLELLLKDYKLELVCSEGADGEVDTSSVSSFPNYRAREKTARIFINSGELTGEEYLSITKYPDLPIWGIEDRDIYFENIIEFNKIMKFSPQSQVFISQAKSALEQLMPRIYSRELLNLEQKETDYENQKIETDEYLIHLSSYIQRFNILTSDYKNITLLTESMAQEKDINQVKIMQESQNLLLNLQAALSSKKDRKSMDALVVKAQLFKEQKISPFSFYSYLKDLALKRIPDKIVKYPNLNEFIDYLINVNSLDTTKLFVEMEALTYEVKQRIARIEEQKTLIKALRNIKFLEGFFNLKVSNEELDYYLENRESHKVGFFESFLKPALKKYNISLFIDYNPDLIDVHLQGLEDFYKTVKARDVAMVRNSVSEIEKRNVKVATLIAGGFHTKGITRLLREKGYSYIVVSPYSSTDIDEENYHFLLSGRRKPITQLLEQLDLPEIVNRLTSGLRTPLPFDIDLKDAWNRKVVPEISKIWGVHEKELISSSIWGRIGPFLALQRGAKRWKSVEVKTDVNENREEVTVKLTTKYSPETGKGGFQESYYIKVTPKSVRVLDRPYPSIVPRTNEVATILKEEEFGVEDYPVNQNPDIEKSLLKKGAGAGLASGHTIIGPTLLPFQPIISWYDTLDKLPGHTKSSITVCFDKDHDPAYTFNLAYPKINESTSEETVNSIANYLSTCIYNRIGVIGTVRILVDAPEALYQKIEQNFTDRFDSEEQIKTNKAVSGYLSFVVNNKPFEFKRSDSKEIKGILKDKGEFTLLDAKKEFDPTKGTLIGIDLGGTAIKAVSIDKGKKIDTYTLKWTPQSITDPKEFIGLIEQAIKEVSKGLTSVDIVGISFAGASSAGKIVGTGPITEGIYTKDQKQFEWLRDNLNSEISKDFGGSLVWVSNDGASGTFGATITAGITDACGLGMGTGLAFSHIDSNGNLNTKILSEGGNVVIDLNPKAPGHTWTEVPGVLQRYISQWGVVGQGEAMQIPEIVNADRQDKSKAVGELLAQNDPRAQKIFQNIGRYLASAIVEYHTYFNMKNVVIFGGVTTAQSGEVIRDTAQEILNEEHPDIDVEITITPEPQYGGAIGAAQLANETNQSLASNERLSGVVDDLLKELDNEDMRGQMTRLYAKESAVGLNATKMTNAGFETDKNGKKINRLGWTTEKVKWLLGRPDKIDDVLRDAEEIRSKYKYVIFCGMGGSGLSVQTVKTTFGEKDIKIYSLRTTDPAVIKDILNDIAIEEGSSLELALRNTLIVPISKSGTTKETVSHKEYFEELYGLFASKELDIKEHMWVITDKGSPMDTGDYEQREIQLNGKGDIGGRFTSPTTHIFLLPMALVAPERVEEILNVAKIMNDIKDINEDTFIELGAYLFHMASSLGKDKLTFMVPDELKDLPMWSEQLVEESLGKDGKGVSIFYGEDLSEVSLKDTKENDRVFLRINIAGKKTNDKLWNYLEKNGYPVFEINVDDVDSIGGLMLGLQRSVATIGYLWDICFVNQPAVEGYKNATRAVMDALKEGETVKVPKDWKGVSFGKLTFYYDRLIKVGAVSEQELNDEVSKLGATMDDAAAVYAAILNILKSKPGFEAKEIASYGKMTQAMKQTLEKARKNIFTDDLKMPSKLGEGPDKNHSYQQNIADGKDMWFSTYFMPLEVEQPRMLEYDDNLIKAQTIGTVNSIVENNRKVALITFDSTIKEAEEDLEAFFAKVGSYTEEFKHIDIERVRGLASGV